MFTCVLPDKYLYAGETAVLLLRGTGGDLTKIENAIVFAQIHANFNADYRWLKATTKLNEAFVDPPNATIDNIHSSANTLIAVPPHLSSQCIFLSSRIAISPTHIFEDGAFLEFEIPKEALSSYKGLCAYISYYVHISIQHPTSTETLNFPLIVRGAGATSTPHHIQYTSLVSYPASSLPVEILLSAPTIASSYGNQGDSDDRNGARHGKPVDNVYMVRDRDHICDLHLSSQRLCPGSDVEVHLDFTDNIQPCSMVRATIVLSEVRSDGSHIQDKVISKAIRTATDAEYLNMVLNIPSELTCSFGTPLFTVEYRIDLDFCLNLRRQHKEQREILEQPQDRDATALQESGSGKNTHGPVPSTHNGEGIFDAALSFSIALTVSPGSDGGDKGTGDGTTLKDAGQGGEKEGGNEDRCGSSVIAVQQRALRCLESSIVIHPISP